MLILVKALGKDATAVMTWWIDNELISLNWIHKLKIKVLFTYGQSSSPLAFKFVSLAVTLLAVIAFSKILITCSEYKH